MQVDPVEAGLLREELEATQDVARLEGCPDLCGEDQTVVLPCTCGGELLLRLSCPVCSECVDGGVGERHASARLVRLGLAEL
jgi:hypothetical protein